MRVRAGRAGEEGVRELDGSKDAEEVLRGQEYMPLHKDGLLMGLEVSWVGIWCERFRGVTDGRTHVCDSAGALDALSPALVQTLEQRGIEGVGVVAGYLESAANRVARALLWAFLPKITIMHLHVFADEEVTKRPWIGRLDLFYCRPTVRAFVLAV